MSYEDELVADALRFLGHTGFEIATPELRARTQRFIDLQQKIIYKRNAAEAEFAAASSPIGSRMASILQEIAPPPRPVRDIVEEALVEVHIPGRAIRGLKYTPWDVVMDFAFPATRLCVMVGEMDQRTGERLLLNQEWFYIHLSEDEIRHDPTGCAIRVKNLYLSRKAARSLR